MAEHTIGSPEDLRERYGSPSRLAADKVIDHSDRHCRRVIELPPFLGRATSAAARTSRLS